jgi:hypothetical protein
VIAILVLLVAALIAFGLGTLLHLHGLAYILFTSLIMLAGIGAAIAILIMHHRSKKALAEAGSDSAGGNTSELDHVLNDVNRKLRASAQVGKTIDQLPLLYVLGESGAAKTTSILRSSLDPELLAGTTGQDTSPAATQFLNVWFTRPGALIEIGSSVRQSTSLFARLIHRTRATAYRSAFGAGTPARAAIVCLSSRVTAATASRPRLVPPETSCARSVAFLGFRSPSMSSSPNSIACRTSKTSCGISPMKKSARSADFLWPRRQPPSVPTRMRPCARWRERSMRLSSGSASFVWKTSTEKTIQPAFPASMNSPVNSANYARPSANTSWNCASPAS